MNTEDTAAAEVALTRIYQQADPDHPAIRLPDTAPRELERWIPDGFPYRVVVVGRIKMRRPGQHENRALAAICDYDQPLRVEIVCNLSPHEWRRTIETALFIIREVEGKDFRPRQCPFCGKLYRQSRSVERHIFAGGWPGDGCGDKHRITQGLAQTIPTMAERGIDPRAIR